jgi:hypothetical protein
MNETATQAEVKYNANANQRYEYEVTQNGERFDTAHLFKPISDERYLQWMKSWDIKSTSDGEADEKYSEATSQLWDDLIIEVENIDLVENWKELIPLDEKLEAIANYLAVAISEKGEKNAGKRSLAPSETELVITEAYFNQKVTSQKHFIKTANREEFRKKYHRIQQKRFKQEKIGGLRRQPKITVVPQDEKIGQLYDEMISSYEGFEENINPLRFKTTVIHSLFGSVLDAKK